MFKYVSSIEESKSHSNLHKISSVYNDTYIPRKKSIPMNQLNDINAKSSFNSLTPHQKNVQISPLFKHVTNSQYNEENEINNNYNIKDSLKLIPFHLFIKVLDVILNENNI